jgi:hypothetical protein
VNPAAFGSMREKGKKKGKLSAGLANVSAIYSKD